MRVEEEKSRLLVDVRGSKTSVLKLSIESDPQKPKPAGRIGDSTQCVC